jgi:hypothetical protein
MRGKHLTLQEILNTATAKTYADEYAGQPTNKAVGPDKSSRTPCWATATVGIYWTIDAESWA